MLFLKRLIKLFITPKSAQKDEARREFILNILLVSVLSLATLGLSISIIHYFTLNNYYGYFPITLLIFVLFLCFLLFLSRKGHSRISASIFIIFLFLSTVNTSFRWGADVPVALLMYSLIIVMSGILLGTKSTFFVTVIVCLGIISLSFLQISQIYKPNAYWKDEAYNAGDVIMRVVILTIIAVVSWLANREIEKSLRRARASEAAVKRQRDQLEILVEKRTQELQIAQAEKIAQLSRFAQFGRTASGLFHDLANPLNLVSLNLDSLRRKSIKMDQKTFSEIKVLLQRAIAGTQRLDAFIQAARRQVQHKEIEQSFSIIKEITQIISMLGYRARKAHVTISFTPHKDMKTFGNLVKFSQVVTNLVLNAIDAYEGIKREKNRIEIRCQRINGTARLEIQDWGVGIAEKDISNIFNPLFTTKTPEKGMGMGLYICKDIVEKDFKGTCTVESTYGVGTTITVIFPIRKTPKTST